MTNLEKLEMSAPRWIETTIDISTGIISLCRVWLPSQTGGWSEFQVPASTIDELKEILEASRQDPLELFLALGWNPGNIIQSDEPDVSKLPGKRNLKDIGLSDL